VVDRKTVQTALSSAYQRHLLVVVAGLLGGCGGHALHGAIDGPASAGSSGEGGNTRVGGVMASGGNGGGGVASGGQAGAGGAMSGGGVDLTWHGSGGVGSTASATGGVTSQGGSASSDQDGGATDGDIWYGYFCDDGYLIWDALSGWVAGIGVCGPWPPPYSPNWDPGPSWGNVVLDSEGRVVDVTEFGVSRTDVVDALASHRWPCMAGQTIPYTCEVGD
jgi:hypothetical protein